MNLNDIFNNISLPKRYYDDTFDIKEKLQEEVSNYIELLEDWTENDLGVSQQTIIKQSVTEIINKVRELSVKINMVLTYYFESDFKSAQECFDEMMSILYDDIFITGMDDYIHIYVQFHNKTLIAGLRNGPKGKYYRVRQVDSEDSSIKNNKDELFHIPLSKRSNACNGRYSLNGFPCLYLTTMLPLAWQECRYPSRYYYSEYYYKQANNDDEINLLAFYSPTEIRNIETVKYSDFEGWLTLVSHYLKTYPLILACSFVAHNGSAKFKQEYIIPQMLMQWIYRNKDRVQGISYFSCIDMSAQISKWCAYNIVIPAFEPYDENKYSIFLRNHFYWSDPKYYTLPIHNKCEKEQDIQFLLDYLQMIRSTANIQVMHNDIRNYLIKIWELCGTFFKLIEKGNMVDNEVALNTMIVLRDYYQSLEKVSIKDLIEKCTKDYSNPIFAKAPNYDSMSDALNEIEIKFKGANKENRSINNLISKYIDNTWND